jgi:hypothetical protein
MIDLNTPASTSLDLGLEIETIDGDGYSHVTPGASQPGQYVIRRITVSENEARHLGPRYTPATVNAPFDAIERRRSPTCSMNSCPDAPTPLDPWTTAMSLRTLCCASTTILRPG